MDNKDSNILNEQVTKIHNEYEELTSEFNILLSDKSKPKPRVRGAISSVGVTVEHLLDYVIRKEGRIEQLNALKPNQRGLYELKRIVEDILPEKQKIHIGTIIPWRNLASHHTKGENISDDELRAVETALNSLINWFFEVYLKGEYADFSKNTYSKKETIIEANREEIREIKENFEKNPLNIPDYSILSESKNVKKKNKFSWVIGIIIGFVIMYVGYNYFYGDAGAEEAVNKTHMDKEQVYAFLLKYYDSNNDKKFDAHQFFANKVDQFYLKKNVNPTEIEIIRQINTDYIDNKNTIDKESLNLYSENDSIRFWRFSGEYTCYRTTRKKFQNCRILMEFGINTENKITRIKEISHSKPEYTKERPL